ncbi:MAG: UDP-2,3-diacylglucosamine diphosphatase LpxI [Rhodospirillales bacterium]|nr:UDP-2,3-diacylglucosamine diphosphatase LpxI [Alphaproteobacteria bacterium]MCB9977428.1 UDP-2,3-diacylglucosamine diphosphatase LpxI [Rhodospirillales bacterium]
MSATKEITVKKLGILAGGGILPLELAQECTSKGIEIFIVGFEGQTSPELKPLYKHFWTGLGAAGSIIRALKEQNISDLVLAGSIRRPWLSELRPDLKGLEILTRIGMGAFGDNSLLTLLKKELEKEGFTIHGVQKFAENMLAKEGVFSRRKPDKSEWQTIKKGLEVSQIIGSLDIGQSVVVQEGLVLGVEAVEGTDKLISRCAELQKKRKGAILVKTCKPQQDRDLDLPTIGPDTVRKAGEAGFSGIAVQAGAALVLDPQTVAEYADKYNMFVIGVADLP